MKGKRDELTKDIESLKIELKNTEKDVYFLIYKSFRLKKKNYNLITKCMILKKY